jgi:hypothetical protein
VVGRRRGSWRRREGRKVVKEGRAGPVARRERSNFAARGLFSQRTLQRRTAGTTSTVHWPGL